MADTLDGQWIGQTKGEQINLKLSSNPTTGLVQGTYIDKSHGGAGRVDGVDHHPEIELIGRSLSNDHFWVFSGALESSQAIQGRLLIPWANVDIPYVFKRSS